MLFSFEHSVPEGYVGIVTGKNNIFCDLLTPGEHHLNKLSAKDVFNVPLKNHRIMDSARFWRGEEFIDYTMIVEYEIIDPYLALVVNQYHNVTVKMSISNLCKYRMNNMCDDDIDAMLSNGCILEGNDTNMIFSGFEKLGIKVTSAFIRHCKDGEEKLFPQLSIFKYSPWDRVKI